MQLLEYLVLQKRKIGNVTEADSVNSTLKKQTIGTIQ